MAYIEITHMTEPYEINVDQVHRGLEMLFDQPLTQEAKLAFVKLAKDSYGRNHCIAWWYSTEMCGNTFSELCRRFGLNPDRREIVINANNRLLYTDDYFHRPQIVWLQFSDKRFFLGGKGPTGPFSLL